MNKTALIISSQAGQIETVRFLLSHGANPTLKDTDGKSALDHTIAINNTEIIELLRQK